MSVIFSLSTGNEHYRQPTPQGYMLDNILALTNNLPNVWYCDTFSIPNFGDLIKYYRGQGTVIMYCWWDPADDRITRFLDEIDLDFIIITSDTNLAPKHDRVQTIEWKYQYGFHMHLVQNTGLYVDCEPKQYLCMMRNHKPERLSFLSALWYKDKVKHGHISYLGQVNTRVHGRAPRPMDQILGMTSQADSNYMYMPTDNFAEWLTTNIPIELPNDNTQHEGNNTDFYTCGNPAWYERTKYSIVLETYWARTQFLTEKTFKPIIAKHPFINLGNRSNELLRSFGFDTFDDVFSTEHDYLRAAKKIEFVVEQLRDVDIDPRRCEYNYAVGQDLLRQAELEQKYLAKQVVELL